MDEESFRGCASAKSHFITIIINSLIICSDEWLALEISALETFYGGQFASSTQLKKPNSPVIPGRRGTMVSSETYPSLFKALYA